MKEITLQEAHSILEKASAVIINYDVLVYPALENLQDDLDNEFLYLSWYSEGSKSSTKFTEEGNQKVKIDGSDMFLIDTDGDLMRLSILVTQKID